MVRTSCPVFRGVACGLCKDVITGASQENECVDRGIERGNQSLCSDVLLLLKSFVRIKRMWAMCAMMITSKAVLYPVEAMRRE